MRRIISTLLAVIMLAAVSAGCGNQEQKAEVTVGNQVTQSKTVETVYPLKVTDYSGFEMTIEKKPQAIIGLSLPADEMLVELVDKNRLKAIDKYAADEGISNIADFAKSFPIKLDAEIEKIIDLQPDLVFVASWKDKAFVQQLRDAGIAVYVFKSSTTFDEVKKSITDISLVVGEAEKGRKMVEQVENKLKSIEDKLKAIKPEDRLTVFYYSFYGSTYAKGTNFDEVVNKAGLINSATKAGMTDWPQVSKEKIIEMDPDIILLPSWSFDKKTDPNKFADDFKKDKSFASLKAVKNDRVYIMQDKHVMQCTSQNMVLGVDDLARAAYPDLFK